MAACGSSADTEAERAAATRQIAQEYAEDLDLDKAQAALNSLDVANPRQWLMLQTETLAADADPAASALALLAAALNSQQTQLEPQKLAASPPLPATEPTTVPTTVPTTAEPTTAEPTTEPAAKAFPSPTAASPLPAPATEGLLALPTPTPPPTLPPTLPQGRATGPANVRSGPDTAFDFLLSLPPDAVVDLIGKTPAGDWWQVRLADGSSGWVFAQLLAVSGAADSVSVAAVLPTLPPPPAPVAAAEPAAPAEAPPAEAVPAEAPPAEAVPQAAAGPHFQLVEKRLWDVFENGGQKDGPTVICGERRELHVYVRDAAGSPLNGVAVQALLGAKEILVTGSQGKGDGKVEFVLGGGQYVTVARDNDGREATAETAYGLTTDPREIPFEQFMAGQYCSDEAACNFWANPTNQPPPCSGHFSWTVFFQRNY
ncbi:MAG: SH3 domain-containing protein [Caldilinea sp.]